MKHKLEYIWLDGYTPEPNLRSKIKIMDLPEGFGINDLPEWSFDGSSTKQAEGNFSDCILKPVRFYNSFDLAQWPTTYVFCEVMNSDGIPHLSNHRSLINNDDDSMWFGFEQEYVIKDSKGNIVGFPEGGYPLPQGRYYCGIGTGNASAREFVDMHLQVCLNAGLEITGVNAEVLLGQWEYQLLSKGKLKAGDDLWMSRYLLYKVAEYYNYIIDLHPKPLQDGDWNGSGLHTNFSTKKMREEGGEEYFNSIFKAFELRHDEHIKVYGSNNHLRLTGLHETQSINKFSHGVSDRGASVRIPQSTTKEWKGYLEDRRPASNANPYEVINVISETFKLVKIINKTSQNMFSDIESTNFEKFNMLSENELLGEYLNDN